jgi:CMP-N,N'-diacetyllegionaminic acid synthase
VVSVTEVPHRFHPSSVMREVDGTLVSYEGGETVTRRQDQAPLVARNGPAVLIVSRATLSSGRMYGPRTVGYHMSVYESVDIDAPEDLRLAALLLNG